MKDETAMRLARDVELFSRLSYDRFLVRAAGGNISVRLPDGGGFLITPTSVSLRDVRAESLIVIDADGRKVAGPDGWKPSKEVNLHLAVYALRPEARAVVHVHPPYATAFATLAGPFPLPTSQSRAKLGPVPVAAYADPGTLDLVRNIEAEMRKPGFSGKAVLLRDHGLITWDADLASAFDTAELVEETGMIAAVAAGAAGGRPVTARP